MSTNSDSKHSPLIAIYLYQEVRYSFSQNTINMIDERNVDCRVFG